ncbi:MAG: hypothetical protein EPO28_11210 [Saprospiraceae bacterium]|nr:MAG: hypothetical protein EPO28_11210 [Saprospiraceae bacterium]
MTISYQREELHRLIDQLDEKWLPKVYEFLHRNSPEKKAFKRKDRWSAVRTKIQSFTRLKNNWDGYGAIPVSPEVADACLNFLRLLPESFLEHLEPENITPTPYSTVTIDWEHGDSHFVTVEIGKSKANFFAQLPSGKTMENEHLDLAGKDFPADLLEALQHLFAHLSPTQ